MTTADFLEILYERSAIMEFDGGVPQHVAEQLATVLLMGPATAEEAEWLRAEWH